MLSFDKVLGGVSIRQPRSQGLSPFPPAGARESGKIRDPGNEVEHKEGIGKWFWVQSANGCS